jgi:hypothetical protein
MVRLEKNQIKQHRAALELWQRPSEMLTVVRKLMNLMGNTDLFNQPGVDFITEAWAAAQFAKGRRALSVRLIDAHEQWPDFEVRTRTREMVQWEFTEVDDPDRRRGQEMKLAERRRAAGGATSEPVPLDAITAQTGEVPDWIRKRCGEKVNKHYSERVGLLIYLNWGNYGLKEEEIEQTFPSATACAKDSFKEVWLLWNLRLYRTWRSGLADHAIKYVPGTIDRL